MSEYFYGAGRKVALHRKPVVARLPERRGISTIGRIVKLLVGQGHGFIRMLNDREIYFHRSDVRDRASFNELVVGDAVAFELLEDAVSGARALRVRRRPFR
ncbi:MAG: hypothetical protein DMF93_05600 [Acidobacteria bacterium]|nr:MAG: hypothetical protein DMF93_05600 [Acidobacteriota bacterium]